MQRLLVVSAIACSLGMGAMGVAQQTGQPATVSHGDSPMAMSSSSPAPMQAHPAAKKKTHSKKKMKAHRKPAKSATQPK